MSLVRCTSRRVGLAFVGVMLAGGAVSVWITWQAQIQPLEVYGAVPDFTLLERSGRTVTRSDFLDKVSVVDFFYTRCTDTCPLQSAHLARLQAEFRGVRDVQFVSISVDPEHDTRDVLASYAARFHADPGRWLFLTGNRQAIFRLAVDGFHLGALVSAQRQTPSSWSWIQPSRVWAHDKETSPHVMRFIHGSRFALVDRHARIRGYFDGTDWLEVQRLSKSLEQLVVAD
jgi:protein SCO1